MNLKFEIIVQIFRKIIQLNTVIILKTLTNTMEKLISKSGPKMDLYPAMGDVQKENWHTRFYMMQLTFEKG